MLIQPQNRKKVFKNAVLVALFAIPSGLGIAGIAVGMHKVAPVYGNTYTTGSSIYVNRSNSKYVENLCISELKKISSPQLWNFGVKQLTTNEATYNPCLSNGAQAYWEVLYAAAYWVTQGHANNVQFLLYDTVWWDPAVMALSNGAVIFDNVSKGSPAYCDFQNDTANVKYFWDDESQSWWYNFYLTSSDAAVSFHVGPSIAYEEYGIYEYDDNFQQNGPVDITNHWDADLFFENGKDWCYATESEPKSWWYKIKNNNYNAGSDPQERWNAYMTDIVNEENEDWIFKKIVYRDIIYSFARWAKSKQMLFHYNRFTGFWPRTSALSPEPETWNARDKDFHNSSLFIETAPGFNFLTTTPYNHDTPSVYPTPDFSLPDAGYLWFSNAVDLSIEYVLVDDLAPWNPAKTISSVYIRITGYNAYNADPEKVQNESLYLPSFIFNGLKTKDDWATNAANFWPGL